MVGGERAGAIEFEGRRAPYAPVSALREFFHKIRSMSTPPRVDRTFLQKLSIASNNEWALLSALKFLGVVDENGIPTTSYRLLQTTDRFQETLRHLVQAAYRDLFETGGADKTIDELRDYFRLTSSPSQAKNAARFFHEVCKLAGISTAANPLPGSAPSPAAGGASPLERAPDTAVARRTATPNHAILEAKARLLEKLPPPHPEWSAQEYQAICDRFLAMLQHLDAPYR